MSLKVSQGFKASQGFPDPEAGAAPPFPHPLEPHFPETLRGSTGQGG